jgi:hypothetical protein
MKRLMTTMALLTLVVVVGCAAPASRVLMTEAPSAQPPAQPAAPEPAGKRTGSDAVTANAPSAQSEERMIVYTVRLSLQVQDADKASSDITAIAAQVKGYVASSNLTRDAKGRMRGSVSVRIPAQSLDETQKKLEAIALKVLSRQRDSKDVTDQYTDLRARLKNLEATEVELTKLLATVRERTGKAEDILAVYNRLIEIRQQIEQTKGQINVLDKTSTFATVTIDLVPLEEIQVLEPDTWMPNKTVAQALKALVQTVQGIADLAIWLLLFVLPVLIVLLLPFIVLALILRAILRRRKKTAPIA